MFSISRQLISGINRLRPVCDFVLGCSRKRFFATRKPTGKYRANPVIMKLDSADFKSLFTPELQALASIFEKYGYEIRIAGGAVRDLLMGKCPKDLDFATIATPDQMKEMFTKENVRMINAKGESHGTITPRINDKENFEITTLRIDVVTDGRRAKVEFTHDWLLDANRRDLTINSMFLGLDGTVYDYFHGYEDLQEKRVVFVGNAEDRIREDYLRILRFFRFFGRITSDPESYDQDTIEKIKANVAGLEMVSGERIWNELRMIISGNFGPTILQKMISIGIGPYVGLSPEPNVEELAATIERTKDLGLHPVCYLAAAVNNMTEALSLNSRLKMSIFERELAYFIVEHREEKLCLKPLLPFQKVMLNSKFKPTDVQEWCVQVFLYNGQKDLAEEMKCWQMPKFPVKGTDFKDLITSHKQISPAMKNLKDYWAEHDFKPDREDLISLIPKFVEDVQILTK